MQGERVVDDHASRKAWLRLAAAFVVGVIVWVAGAPPWAAIVAALVAREVRGEA